MIRCFLWLCFVFLFCFWNICQGLLISPISSVSADSANPIAPSHLSCTHTTENGGRGGGGIILSGMAVQTFGCVLTSSVAAFLVNVQVWREKKKTSVIFFFKMF